MQQRASRRGGAPRRAAAQAHLFEHAHHLLGISTLLKVDRRHRISKRVLCHARRRRSRSPRRCRRLLSCPPSLPSPFHARVHARVQARVHSRHLRACVRARARACVRTHTHTHTHIKCGKERILAYKYGWLRCTHQTCRHRNGQRIPAGEGERRRCIRCI